MSRPVRLSEPALRWWTGKTRARGQSEQLHGIAKDLWRAGASRSTIVAALAERDVALHPEPKYSGRPDAVERYSLTADRAIAEVERERTPAPTRDEPPADPACAKRVAQLEAKVGRLQEAQRAEREAHQRSRDHFRLCLDVLRNPDLPTTEGMTLLAVAFDAASGQSRQVDQDGFIRVSLDHLAETSGNNKSTVSRHLKRTHEEMQVIERRVIRHAPNWVNPDTGEIMEGYTSELWIRFTSTPDDPRAALKHLVEISPPRKTPKHGGKREPKRYPQHPRRLGVIR